MTNALVKFSAFVNFPLKCFKIFGLIPHKIGDASSWKRKLLSVYHVFVIVNLMISLVGIAIYISQNISDLALIAESEPVSAFSYAVINTIKSIMFYLRQNDFKDLIDTLDDLFPKTRAEQDISEVRKYLNGYKRLERVFMTMVCSMLLVLIGTPVAKLITAGIWNDKLPLAIWFPFNQNDPKFYSFVYIWEFFLTFSSLAISLGPDLILYALITLISFQFDVLCRRLRQMKNVPSSDIKNTFVELVELHKVLIRLSDKLRSIFSQTIFFYVFGNSIFLCLYLYHLSRATTFEDTNRLVVLLTFLLLQILVLCYHGSKLITASENVADAAYDSGWNHTENREFRYFSLFMIQLAHRPKVISASKFSIVSLHAFGSVSFIAIYEFYDLFYIFQIINCGYSYFTLLQSMNGK